MEILDAIKKTRAAWENRVIQHLARGVGVRDDFRSQLDRFSDALEEAVKTGDPAWMDPTLALWATSLTPNDMEASQANLSHLLKELSLISMETWQEHLPGELALSVITAVLPVYAYAFEKAAELEIRSHAAFISAQLVRTQQTLNRMEQSKTDFIAVAAHELKTPLTLVEGYAAMLRETFSSTDQGRLLVDGIYTGTHRLRLIVNDIPARVVKPVICHSERGIGRIGSYPVPHPRD
jgi:signal transduction histidine kinase